MWIEQRWNHDQVIIVYEKAVTQEYNSTKPANFQKPQFHTWIDEKL